MYARAGGGFSIGFPLLSRPASCGMGIMGDCCVSGVDDTFIFIGIVQVGGMSCAME